MTLYLRAWLGDLELTDYPFALGFGMDLGRPENVYAVMESLLADGEVVSSNRTSNRSLSLPVLVEGADMQELADNEAALVAECEKSLNLLTIDPGDGYGPPTVFRVFRAQAKHNRDDDAEMARLRQYTVEFQALPAAYSASATTVGAEFVASSVTIADDCESATGWTATALLPANNPVTPSVDSSVFATGTGSVKFTQSGVIIPAFGEARSTISVDRTGLSIDASGGGYFVARLKPEWSFALDENPNDLRDFYITTSGGGRESVSPLLGEIDTNGFLKLSFVVPNASTITAFEFTATQTATGVYSSIAAPSLWVDSLGLAGNSSAPQNVMSFDVAGSMRCEGSFTVSAAAGLGDVVLYTVPDKGDGFRPDLARWQASGATTVDVNAINGHYTALSASPTFSAPASMFRSGSYAVLARVKRSAAGSCTITVTAQTKSGATSIGPQESVTSGTITLTDADYHVVRLGVIELPPLVTDPASDATVLFTATRSGTDYHLDELLVFPLEDHALTWVACGSGSPSATVASRFWIDEPSPSQPRGARLVGNDAGRLDARYVLPESRGRHVLKPGRMLAYLLTSAAGGADLQVTYTAAHHSNASS